MNSSIVETVKVPAREISPSELNHRRHPKRQMTYLTGSLQRHGLVVPLIAYRKEGELVLIGGHARLSLANPDDVLDVSVLDVTEEQAAELMLIIDKVPTLAGEDPDAVSTLLSMLSIPSDSVGDLLELIARDAGLLPVASIETDEIPEHVQRRTHIGDLFALGDHRLHCGDSTEQGAYLRLFEGQGPARMCFTDPPYAVAIGQDSNPRHRQRSGLTNDDLPPDQFEAFLAAFIAACSEHFSGDLYLCMGSEQWPLVDGLLRESGYHWSATIIWVKDLFVLGRSKFQRRYEPIWYGWKQRSSFGGRRDQDDVWEISRPRVSKDHPTIKPVELVSRAIMNSCDRGEIVLDPFCGSGTSLLAAEAIGRRCFGIEIDPGFCDVAIARFEKATGTQAELIGGLS